MLGRNIEGLMERLYVKPPSRLSTGVDYYGVYETVFRSAALYIINEISIESDVRMEWILECRQEGINDGKI